MLNFKGIYTVLSQIWKCCKLRIFGANFFGPKIGWCLFYAFLQLCPCTTMQEYVSVAVDGIYSSMHSMLLCSSKVEPQEGQDWVISQPPQPHYSRLRHTAGQR